PASTARAIASFAAASGAFSSSQSPIGHSLLPMLIWTKKPGCERASLNRRHLMTTTRFAPSPTGHIHVGNLRAALFNYLIARKAGGTFILRLDDTDQERSKQEYVDGIMRDLDWLGMHWDRVERQSLRLDRYAETADQLRASGHLYEVFETPTELDL